MKIAFRNTTTNYGLVGRVLHWASVATFVLVYYYASLFNDIGRTSVDTNRMLNMHVAFGILLIVLMLTRLAWRSVNVNPVKFYRTPRWQKAFASGIHSLLYVAIISQCAVGIAQTDPSTIMSILNGLSLDAAPATTQTPLRDTLIATHKTLANLVVNALCVHVLGAFYNQVFGVVVTTE